MQYAAMVGTHRWGTGRGSGGLVWSTGGGVGEEPHRGQPSVRGQGAACSGHIVPWHCIGWSAQGGPHRPLAPHLVHSQEHAGAPAPRTESSSHVCASGPWPLLKGTLLGTSAASTMSQPGGGEKQSPSCHLLVTEDGPGVP